MEVIWQRKATKQLMKIGDRRLRERITNAVDALEAVNSINDCAAAKELNNHAYDYRLRVGDWRVMIDLIAGEPVIASIEEVKKRDERTY